MAERKTKSAERNRLTGRVRRYAKVGTAVGGAAARLAGERFLGLPLDRARHAADLKTALGGLKGPLMKVAQLLSTIPDALPEEYAAELAGLQSNAPSMCWNFVKRRMAAELGPDWQSRFKSSSPRRRPRLRWARFIAPSRKRGRGSPASCNIPTWRARSRPISASSG